MQIQVTVPEHHHAYLDKGRDGVLLDLQFNWQKLIESGALKKEPEKKSAPAGAQDDTAHATVLRGTGTFEFIAPAKDVEGKNLAARIQICNETRGICYRPETIDVQIQ